ncbi:MAG: stage II sporulation protein P [Halanaerobiales bacterium]
MSIKKYKFVFIVLIAVILIILNIRKYREMNDVVVPVWSSYDEEYYNNKDLTTMDKIRNTFSVDRLVYGLTRVRLRAPLTYLKREIPILAYYTPEELKQQTETIYRPESNQNSIIRLKFNIQDEADSSGNVNIEKEEESIDIPDNREITPEQRPLIAIYHTHTSETYMDDPRNQDNNYHVLPGNIGNVGKVGIEMARILSEEYGFRVIHTTKIHDETYNRSYFNSRNTVKSLLAANPDIDLIIDIHRDGIKANLSRDMLTTVIKNQRAAKVMIVIGNGKYNYGELSDINKQYNWEENLKFANSMSAVMDSMYPGLLRRVEIRDTTANRYNQDLHPRSILLEMGDYRNTTQEALEAAKYVADVIGAMY